MKTRSRAFVWLLLTFLAGVGLGATSTAIAEHYWRVDAGSPDRTEGRSSSRYSGDRLLRGMIDQLELDTSQEEAVRKILETSRVRMKQADRNRYREHRKIRNETVEEIRQVLRPDQERRLDEFLEQLHQRFKKHRSGSSDGGKSPADQP